MVEQMVTLLTYLPLAAAGLALMTAWIRLLAFSSSLSGFETHLAARARG